MSFGPAEHGQDSDGNPDARAINNPVYVVDWEDDPDHPVIFKVEITEVIKDDKGTITTDHLGMLLAGGLEGAFNMSFAKDKESALKLLDVENEGEGEGEGENEGGEETEN
jgi:hypothetical protein